MTAARSGLVVLAAITLAACSKAPRTAAAQPAGSPSATAASSTGPEDSPSPLRPITSVSCSMVSAAQVNAALGTGVGGPNVNRSNPSASVCTYSGGTPFTTVIILAQGQDASGFAHEKEASNANRRATRDVPGYGDEAYTSAVTAPGGVTVTTLAARKGDVEILITARRPLEPIGALMARILARI